MDKNNFDLETAIPSRREDERVWVVRASGGQYVRHFKHAGVVAVGHLDRLDFASAPHTNEPRVLSLTSIRKALEGGHKLARATVTSHLSQVQQFCREMKVNDLVVTVDSSSVAVGRVTGYSFFDRTAVDLSTDDYKDDPMNFQLRRPVAWGPTFSRRHLPLPMERVFSSHRTVFDITRFWDYIYHLLYPAFTFRDQLHLTLRIKREEDIRNQDIVSLLLILQEFERISSERSGDEVAESLTVRAGFFSKGDIWPRLTAKEKKLAYYLFLTSLLLGGGEIGPVKINGAGHFIKELIEIGKGVINDNDGKKAVENLQIDVPRLETEPVEKMPRQPSNRETILIARD